MISIEENNKSECCGCTACASICPKNAIEMREDFEGFLYPVIDKEKCINCGLCDKTCLYKNPEIVKDKFLKAYAIQNRNDEILNNSTSGGFFTPLAHFIIENKGYVFGAVFNELFEVEHKMTDFDNQENLIKYRGSKYVQSNLKDSFKNIKKLLDNEQYVCFSGTPCQVLGLKKYLNKEYNNLITVDFVCRSVPSPLFLKKYIEFQEKKYKSKIKEFYFRSKTYGYHSGTLTIKFKNGKKYTGSNRIDLYNKMFHSDYCSRYSCYNCPAKGLERCSDFTVFDSWNPSKLNNNLKDNDKGFSNLIIHSKKGYELFKNALSESFICYEIDAKEAISFTGGMATESIKFNDKRKRFYKELNDKEKDFEKIVLDYINISLIDKLFEKTKIILYKMKLLKIIKKMKRE